VSLDRKYNVVRSAQEHTIHLLYFAVTNFLQTIQDYWKWWSEGLFSFQSSSPLSLHTYETLPDYYHRKRRVNMVKVDFDVTVPEVRFLYKHFY